MTMFETNVQANQARGGKETIIMTDVATEVAVSIKQRINNKEWAEELVIEAAKDHDKMDAFLQENNLVDVTKFEMLNGLDDDLVDRMIKSQQSKRSRSKSKALTEQVFTAMLVGAICENVLRAMYDKEKGHTFATNGANTFTDEEYEALANDQEALARAIRNFQSKKSIAKSKANFDENSDYYQTLVETEEKLKSLRTGSSKSVLPIKSLLKDVNIDGLKVQEAKELLAKIKELADI